MTIINYWPLPSQVCLNLSPPPLPHIPQLVPDRTIKVTKNIAKVFCFKRCLFDYFVFHETELEASKEFTEPIPAPLDTVVSTKILLLNVFLLPYGAHKKPNQPTGLTLQSCSSRHLLKIWVKIQTLKK